jgi:hypothetical protein
MDASYSQPLGMATQLADVRLTSGKWLIDGCQVIASLSTSMSTWLMSDTGQAND